MLFVLWQALCLHMDVHLTWTCAFLCWADGCWCSAADSSLGGGYLQVTAMSCSYFIMLLRRFCHMLLYALRKQLTCSAYLHQ